MTLMPLKTSDHLLFGKRVPGGVAGRGRWSSPGAAAGRGRPGWRRNWYTERQVSRTAEQTGRVGKLTLRWTDKYETRLKRLMLIRIFFTFKLKV